MKKEKLLAAEAIAMAHTGTDVSRSGVGKRCKGAGRTTAVRGALTADNANDASSPYHHHEHNSNNNYYDFFYYYNYHINKSNNNNNNNNKDYETRVGHTHTHTSPRYGTPTRWS